MHKYVEQQTDVSFCLFFLSLSLESIEKNELIADLSKTIKKIEKEKKKTRTL